MPRFTLLLLVPLLACGPGKGDLDDAGDGSSSGGGTSGETTAAAPATDSVGHSTVPGTDGVLDTTGDGEGGSTQVIETSSPTTPTGATTTEPDDSGEPNPTVPAPGSTTADSQTTADDGGSFIVDPDDDDGGSFIVDPDDDDGGSFIVDPDPPGECSPWLEDCAEGEKCMPVDGDGSGSWNTTQCRPIQGDTAPGGACLVDGGAFTGNDSCEKHAMCFGVDDELAGDCVGMCEGTPEDPTCPQGKVCAQLNGGILNLCLDACDPLVPTCGAGDVCVPVDLSFVCVPAASETGGAFEACEFLNACDVGNACLSAELSPDCDPNGIGCCLPFCSLVEPPSCPGGLSCVPWFEQGQAPPGLEEIGVCAEQL